MKSKGKVLMVIARLDFQDAEYFIPKELLEKAGYEIITASWQKGQAFGVMGGETLVNLLIKEAKIEDYQGVVFIGGPGMAQNLDDNQLHQLAKSFFHSEKIVAAICIAPLILAKAGILQGKKATVWSSVMDKSPLKTLQTQGAIYENKPVVIDGKIITANGPVAAEEFGEKIREILENQ